MMKKFSLTVLTFLFFVLFLGAQQQAYGQYWIVGFSQTNVDQGSRLVRAKSGTFVDYRIAYDYIPRVHYGELYRTDDQETDLGRVDGYGHPYQLVIDGIPTSLIGIGFDYSTNNYVPGKTYCTYTTHWVGGYEYRYNNYTYYYDPLRVSMFSSNGGGSQYPWTFSNPQSYYAVFKWYRLGPTQECKVVPYDAPVITNISPGGGQEASAVPVVITGSNFVNPQISVSGNGVAAAIVNSTANTITATFAISPNADLTSREVKVTANGGNSNAVNFQVGDHSPVAQSITPPEGNRGTTVSVSVAGSFFGGDPELVIDGAGVTAAISSKTDTQIQANLTIAGDAAEGNRAIKVRSKGRSGNGFILTPGASDLSNAVNFNVKRPANPTLNIDEVGFGGDLELRRYPGYLGATSNNPIEDITWKRSSSTNANNPVVYTKDTVPSAMNLKGKFTVSPTPSAGQNLNIKLRVKRGGTVVAASTGSLPVNSDTVSFDNLTFSEKLEQFPLVKKGIYNFDWEVSFDDGQNWTAAGNSQGHPIYWLYGMPQGAQGTECNPGSYWKCTFSTGQGSLGFAYLYDLALEKAIEPLSQSIQTPELIAYILAADIDRDFIYDPSFVVPDSFHPLEMFVRRGFGNDDFSKAQCSANANLVTGLLRSLGVPAQTIYTWGAVNSFESDYGSARTMYRYRRNAAEDGYQSFKVKRPLSSEGGITVNPDPHFTFHALVRVNGNYYDPSYEAKLTYFLGNSINLLETVDLSGSTPAFKEDAATVPFVGKAFSMAALNSNPANTIATNALCLHSSLTASLPHSFDSDRKADVAVWRPSDGYWYVINSSNGSNSYTQFGQNGDQITPGDYDGDGTTDIAVYRPGDRTWYRIDSSSQVIRSFIFGDSDSVPVSGDFDGDGKTDLAVRTPGTTPRQLQQVKIMQSSNGALVTVTLGSSRSVSASRDYDGDGKTDVAVFTAGTWDIIYSSDNALHTSNFGQSNDIPISADYDGDGKSDIAIYRPSTGTWWIMKSSDGSHYAVQHGSSSSIPVAGDYDGDSKTDLAVFTNGQWSILKSSDGGVITHNWGQASDVPIPSAFR